MFKGDSMYSILPIDATYFFNITKTKNTMRRIVSLLAICAALVSCGNTGGKST